MDRSKAGGDHVLIQTFLFYYVNQVVLMLISIFKDNFHNKAKQVCIKARSNHIHSKGTKPTWSINLFLCISRTSFVI